MVVKKVFVLAGEASGDVLGAEFLRALRAADPQAAITYTGGPAMREVLQGQVPWVPMEQMAFMGFVEVLRHLPQIWRNDQTIKRALLDDRPDLIVLIDYPGYGLRLAKWLNAQGFRSEGRRIVQLVSPQFWAWKPGRLATLKSCFDAVYPLLPFESPLLTKAGVVAPYFGHPAATRVPAGGWDPEGTHRPPARKSDPRICSTRAHFCGNCPSTRAGSSMVPSRTYPHSGLSADAGAPRGVGPAGGYSLWGA